MAYLRKVCSVVTLVFVVLLKNTIADYDMRLYCYDQDDGSVKKMVRLKTNGDSTLTGLQAYSVDIGDFLGNPQVPITDTECTQTSKMTSYPDVYELEFSGDCDDFGLQNGNVYAASCQVGYRNEWYRTTARLCSDYLHYHDIVQECGKGTWYGRLLLYRLQLNIAIFGSRFCNRGIKSHKHYPNPFNIDFAVFEADGWNAPATEVLFGQDIKLRLTYNMGELENGPDNWGTTFNVGFTTHAAATDLVLEVVTPGLGTNIHIRGELSGSSIDRKAIVKRDQAFEMPIPKAYTQTSSNDNDWLLEGRGIRVKSFDDRIGVRVISKNGDGSSYVALPDDVLGTSYRPVTLDAPADTDGEVVIVGTTYDPEVTISYNGYSIPVGLDVGGVNVATTDTQTVVEDLDIYEVLHIKCGGECDKLVIEADAPIAVLYGLAAKAHANDTVNTGHVMTQLTPFKYFHDEFVLTTPTGFEGSFVVQTDDPADSPVLISDNTDTTTVKPSLPYLSAYNSEQTLDQNVAYYFHSEALTAGADPALLPIPSKAQWGIFNFFYARKDSSYLLTFVGSHLDEITFKTGGVTTSLVGSKLEDQPGYSVTAVPPISGSPTYFTYEVTITITQGDEGLIEFRAEKTWTPFMLFILEETGTFRTSYLPYGVRYPPTNPCSTTTARSGDILDNDCDGRVDEEIQNGIDDDGDGSIDEDPALDIVTRATGVAALYVEVCGDGGCSLPIFEGCFYDYYYDDDGPFYMEPFVHNEGLADEFDHLYVIETPAFNAWRYVSGGDFTIVVYYRMCLGELDLCENSCRTKRSADDVWAVSKTLPVVRNGTELIGEKTDSATTDTKPHPCSNNPVFWVPVTLLLLMLLIETGVSVFFVYKRSQFIKLLR